MISCIGDSRDIKTESWVIVASNKVVANLAWAWCHSSYGGDFCLRYPTEVLACGLLYGAAKDLDFEVRLFMRTGDPDSYIL